MRRMVSNCTSNCQNSHIHGHCLQQARTGQTPKKTTLKNDFWGSGQMYSADSVESAETRIVWEQEDVRKRKEDV